MSKVDLDALYSEARKAAEFASVPYSKFRVGAALLLENGSVITGCNVENRSYGLTICAERTAVVKAVSQGFKSFRALAVSTPDSQVPVGPCGACRQVLSEFMEGASPVIFGGSGPDRVETSIAVLYPFDSLHELGQS
jgi:cytidine deaminase